MLHVTHQMLGTCPGLVSGSSSWFTMATSLRLAYLAPNWLLVARSLPQAYTSERAACLGGTQPASSLYLRARGLTRLTLQELSN